MVGGDLGRFDESAPHVAQLGAKLDLESSVFAFTDGNKVATTFIENRGELLLHLLCGHVPARDGDQGPIARAYWSAVLATFWGWGD
jgi:hypothetical protein